METAKMSESGGKKFFSLSMEVVAYILGAILILVNLGMVSFRIYIISNKQWAVDKAELVDGVEEKYKLVSFDFSFPFVFFFQVHNGHLQLLHVEEHHGELPQPDRDVWRA